MLLVLLPIVLAVMAFFLTRDQPKEYTSSTRVYTGITTGSSITSLESSKVDLFATRTAFDNLIGIIKSRSTLEEVSMRLLATDLMLDSAQPEIISVKSYNDLMKMVPQKIKDLVVKGDIEATLDNFRKYKDSNFNNFIYKLINYDHPFYSSQKISSNVTVHRVQSSDLIDIRYKSSDPGICKSTLDILTQVFIQEYASIKVNQSDAVSKYFQTQIEHANEKLNDAENELLEFNRTNTIINYYEQTKHIAAEKELFDMRYLEIKLMYAGAQSVIIALEDKMSVRQKQRLNSESISNLREEMAQVNMDITMKTFEEQTDTAREDQLVKEIGALRVKAYDLGNKLKLAVQEQYYIDNSTEGIATTSILEDWIDKVVELEASKAQLKVAELQEQKFVKLFENYAPLGATMKRLERKINVAEREYLSLLHSLGVAKLNQQSIEMNSNLKIVTKPLFPIVAEPSKRKFILLIAFMIGFIIPAFVIIVLEFFDQNLKTAARAEKSIGLSVAAIFPKLVKMSNKLDVEFIKNKGLDIIARRLILNAEERRHTGKTDTNILFSSLGSEGKTTLATLLLEKLATIGYNVLFLTYNNIEQIPGIETRTYAVNKSFHKVENIQDLETNFEGLELSTFDYIFIEFPGVLHNTYPINLFKNTDHSFLVTRANRAWTKSDAYALTDIIEFTKDKKPQILLNGVEVLEMESVIGDLPRQRSTFRKLIKDVFRFQFFNKSSLCTSRAKRKIKHRSKGLMLLLLVLVVGSSAFLLFSRWNRPPVTENNTAGIITIPQVDCLRQNEEQLFAEIDQMKPDEIELFSRESSEVTSLKSANISKAPKVKYYLVGGSFREEQNAILYQKELRGLGYDSKCVKRIENLHTVFIGEYYSNQEVKAAQMKYLKIEPDSKAWILEEAVEPIIN